MSTSVSSTKRSAARHPSWDKMRGGPQPGCANCGNDDKRHGGRGMCSTCYSAWRRANPDHERHYKPFLRRMRDGQTEYRCNQCMRWWHEDFFYDNKHQAGASKYTKCKRCMRGHRARYAPGYRERRRVMARARTEEARRQDRAHEGILQSNKFDDAVPAGVVRQYVDIAIERMPKDADTHGDVASLMALAEATGINYRSLYRIRREAAIVSFDLAEKIAMAAGEDIHAELLEAYPVLGKEGWGPEGRTSCDRCGTWWRPHTARGYCSRCYNAVWRAEKAGVPVTLPSGSWSRRWAHCRRCGQSKKRHHGRGMCGKCYWHVQHLAMKLGMTFDQFLESGLLVPLRT